MTDPVAVRLLDRDYLVGSPPEQRASLLAAAQLLDGRLREMRQAHKTETLERIAVLVALNLAHELHVLQSRSEREQAEIDRTLGELNRRLEVILAG